MALPLETRVVWQTLRRPWAALLGSAVNMGLLPLLAWGASHALADQLGVGLIVAATAPCTLASAAVWTRRAGGNDAAAILVTLITNSTCFLVTPFWLILTTQTEASFDVRRMIVRLGLLVVLPMAVAQLLRRSSAIARFATQARGRCAVLAQIGILSMVLIGAVTCSGYLADSTWRESLSPLDLLAMIAMTQVLHLVALGLGSVLASACRLSPADQIAVAFAGSQKTLMVGLFVAINYFGGLAILPMVSYHVGQLFLDTIIADRWAARAKPEAEQAR